MKKTLNDEEIREDYKSANEEIKKTFSNKNLKNRWNMLLPTHLDTK